MKSSQEPTHDTESESTVLKYCVNPHRLFSFLLCMWYIWNTYIHSSPVALSSPPIPLNTFLTSLPLTCLVSCLFSNDLLNLIRAICMSLGVELFPGVWAIYQWPHHCKKKKKWLTWPQQPLTGSGSLKPCPIHTRTVRSLVLCRWPQLLCVCKCKDCPSQPSSPPPTLTFLCVLFCDVSWALEEVTCMS